MTKFTDGPAAGVQLWLRRAPLFLRAVQNRAGDWDALDQLHDEPKAQEVVVVYRKIEDKGFLHLKMSGKGAKHGSGFYAMASYTLHEEQPDVEVGRDNAKWRAWAHAQAEKMKDAEKAVQA